MDRAREDIRILITKILLVPRFKKNKLLREDVKIPNKGEQKLTNVCW